MKSQNNQIGFLFDLDQTLIDSKICEQHRRERNWTTVYSLIPLIKLYPGIPELLKSIKKFDHLTCIITSSPSPYCQKLINHLHLNVDATVCYHDTGLHKPNPEPINEGLRRLKIESTRAYSIGDTVNDIMASKSAGVFSIAALWGSNDQVSLKKSNPDYICNSVSDLKNFCSTVMVETE